MSHGLVIATVVYENYTVLDDFLRSLSVQTDKNFHLFISDLSKEKKPIETEGVNLTVSYGENKGYAYGINLSLKNAIGKGFDKFCVINNDTSFENEFVESVNKSIDLHPESIIGGKIYYAPGFEYHKSRYKNTDLGKVIWYAGGKTDWNHVITHHVGVDEIDEGDFNIESETDFVTGCLMCFDKKLINKIGFLDESYFLFYEDADYCERAKRKGLKLYFDPLIKIWHKSGQSTEGAGSKLQQKYQRKSRLKFGLKYAPLKTKLHLLKNDLLSNIKDIIR